MRPLRVQDKVTLKREVVKSILRGIDVFKANGILNLKYSEELLLLLSYYLKKDKMIGTIIGYGARTDVKERILQVRFKNRFGNFVGFFDRNDLTRTFRKRK